MPDREHREAELEEYLVQWLLTQRTARRGWQPGGRSAELAVASELVAAVESGDLRADALLCSTAGRAAKAAVDRVLPWPERPEADLFVAAVELAAAEVRRGRTRDALTLSGVAFVLLGVLVWSRWR